MPRVEIYEENVRCSGGEVFVDLVIKPLKDTDNIDTNYTCDCEGNCDCPMEIKFYDKDRNTGFSDPSQLLVSLNIHRSINGLVIYNLRESQIESILDLLRQTMLDYDNSINTINRRLRRRWEI